MSHLFKKFKNDILGLSIAASGLFLALALISFNPLDPSFNSMGKSLHATNYCGYVGSFLADSLFEVLGVSAWLLVAGALRMSVLAFKGEEVSFRSLRMVWASILILTVAALCSLYFPQTRIYHDQIMVGGLVGMGLSHLLVLGFNFIGAQVVLWTAIAMLAVFYSEKSLQELLRQPGVIMAFFSGLLKVKNQKMKISKKEKAKDQEKESAKSEGFTIRTEERPESRSGSRNDEPAAGAEAKGLLKKPIQLLLSPASALLDSNKPAAKAKAAAEAADAAKVEAAESAEDAAEANENTTIDTQGVRRRKVVIPTKVVRHIENWELPKLKLLEDPPASRIKIDEKEIKRKADILKEKLGKFEVTGEVVAARPGPAVTMFEFRPHADVKLSEVTALADDLSLALSSESLRILAPIPGRDVVGIETSNAQREVVYFKDMLGVEDFWKEDMRLPVALGKTSTGESKIVDLRRLPHLMVAGTTGSGKSVFTVSLIMGLLFKHSPKTLKLIIVDPKQVDYAAFEKIPHLAMPVIGDTRQAVVALKWAVNEMEKRYRSMSRFGARGLESYNETVAKLTKEQIEEHDKINQELDVTPGKKGDKYYFNLLPYMVIILEEFGDLMTVDKNNVEHSVVRLAQKARACGMHLVLAMQSPRKEVVTGLIKTNIPGRIAFKVSSTMDSRVILDETGAERLLAQGDMLFKSPGSSSLIRHHGPFLKDSEVIDIAKFWAEQGEPEFDQSAMRAINGDGGDGGDADEDGGSGDEEYDDRYDEILSWASSQKTISASLIQRRFSLGYPRAARLIETFERERVVGPQNGSKPRQVLINSLASLDE